MKKVMDGSRFVRRYGFSTVELLIVISVGLVITAAALPSVNTVVADVRTRTSISTLSGLLQSCRAAAVQQSVGKTAHFVEQGGGLVAYVKNVGDPGSLARADIQVKMEAPISKLTAPTGAGAPAAISAGTLGFTPQTSDVSFNPRGLPCAYSGGTCTSLGFVYYFMDTRRKPGEGWSAISVSPAGRITKWFWNGSTWGD